MFFDLILISIRQAERFAFIKYSISVIIMAWNYIIITEFAMSKGNVLLQKS